MYTHRNIVILYGGTALIIIIILLISKVYRFLSRLFDCLSLICLIQSCLIPSIDRSIGFPSPVTAAAAYPNCGSSAMSPNGRLAIVIDTIDVSYTCLSIQKQIGSEDHCTSITFRLASVSLSLPLALRLSAQRFSLISSLFVVTMDPGKSSMPRGIQCIPPEGKHNNNITFQWGMLNLRHLVQLQPAASSNRTVRPLALFIFLCFFFSFSFSLYSLLIVVIIILVTATIYELHLHH